MIIQKSELSQKIERIKSIVPKKSAVAAIQGILLKDSYLIATNHEITIRARLKGAEGESFLIPQKAFDLIKNLPDGEMEISAGVGNVISIKSESINNKFQSLSPEMFSIGSVPVNDRCYEMTVDSRKLKDCVKNVLYAVSKVSSGQKMGALCIRCKDGYLHFAGMDGHMLAWDKLAFQGEKAELLIPREAAEKLLQLDFNGKVKVEHSQRSAVFTTEEYIIETRLIDGPYFQYEKVFDNMTIHTSADRKKIMDAINRAAMCIDHDSRMPIRLKFESDSVRVYLDAKNAEYSEMVFLDEPVEKPVLIAFDHRLLMETLKAFETEKVHVDLLSGQHPLRMNADGRELKAIVLPVSI